MSPKNHLLRLIDKYVSFAFVRVHLKDSYSKADLLLRFLLIGSLCGITSERKLVEELGMHLAWQWFTGLSFISRFRITPPFPPTVTGVSRLKLFRQLFERLSAAAWQPGW